MADMAGRKLSDCLVSEFIIKRFVILSETNACAERKHL
jgi:hypothetical protein